MSKTIQDVNSINITEHVEHSDELYVDRLYLKLGDRVTQTSVFLVYQSTYAI